MTKCLTESIEINEMGQCPVSGHKTREELMWYAISNRVGLWNSLPFYSGVILVLIINRDCNLPDLHTCDYLYTQRLQPYVTLSKHLHFIYICTIGLKTITGKNCLNCQRILSYGFLNKTTELCCILILKISRYIQGNKIKMKLYFRRTMSYILGNWSVIYFNLHETNLVSRERTVQPLTYLIKVDMPLASWDFILFNKHLYGTYYEQEIILSTL